MSYKYSLSALICIIALTLITPPALATELNVPSQYATIQAAINAAATGNTIIIEPGTYTGDGNRDLDFLGKAITVKSVAPENPAIVTATIIDCGGSSSNNHRGFYFHSAEGSDSIIDGLTIKNGYYEGYGGAIYIDTGCSPSIKNCQIMNNNTRGFDNYSSGGYACGGGLYSKSELIVVLENCIIAQNNATGGNATEEFWGVPGNAMGGGLYGKYLSLKNCLVIFNRAQTGIGWYPAYAYGGGLYSKNNASLESCTIAYNDIGDMGGGNDMAVDNLATMIDCIIWNSHNYSSYGNITATYCCTKDDTITGTGNIHTDPCFVTGPLGNYYLSQTAAGQAADSPCVDAGSDTAANLGLDIKTTRTDDAYDSGIVDMGYHYFSVVNTPFISAIPTSLAFTARMGGGNPANKTFDVSNVGIDTLNWTLTESCPWLSADPCSGSSTGITDIDIVTISVDTAGLAAGDYNYDITISDTCAANSPVTVPVSLHIDDYDVADINNDGDNNLIDFSILKSQWLDTPGTPSADIAPDGGDNFVDIEDAAFLAQRWLGYTLQWSTTSHTELNTATLFAEAPHLSADKLTLYYGRRTSGWSYEEIAVATRTIPQGPFTFDRALTELGDNANSPWLSTDGQRLYYTEVLPADGKRWLRQAAWNAGTSQWESAITFSDIHVSGYIDVGSTLTADELTLFFHSNRPGGQGDCDIWMATRASINDQFSSPVNVTELNSSKYDAHPSVSPDGLTIYFTANTDTGWNPNIYKATRTATSDPFSNITPVPNLSETGIQEDTPFVSSDEKTFLYVKDYQALMEYSQISAPIE